ncbi:MAG TPA: hypothetical protein VFY34_10585 [Pyrinomonadaceae bacterium]|nr:hypothetical protein [Pyrinomonadaceae bacterium]
MSTHLGLLGSFLVRFPVSPMAQLISARYSILRAAIVVAALFSLCVSSNVGPRFLPLPTLEHYAAENVQQTTGTTASRSRSQTLARFRVPMAQGQKRADRELQPQPVAVPAGLDVVLPDSTRVFAEVSDPYILYTVALAALPSGRAPPRLV